MMIAMLSRLFSGSTKADATYQAPPATRVYAVGDIHGQLDLLRRLRELIADDAQVDRRERNVDRKSVV